MTLTEEKGHAEDSNQPVDPSQNFLRVARAGNLAKVLDFLNSGMKIDTCNANGLNALHLASKEGHTAVVRELLMRNADPDASTKKGNTALHIASLAGQLDVVKLLVEKGARVNCQSQNGFTPLYMAAQENHLDVVKFLLASGASQTLATTDGFTPLAVALQQCHDKVVACLLENDSRGRSRMPALHVAAKKDDVRSATLLLTSDCNPNQQAGSGFTALHIAAHYGSQSVAALLIEKGADVNFQARNNITPLHVAAKWGMLPVVQKLIENNAEVDCKTRDGLTPLHCASRSGQYAVVDQLLTSGASFGMKSRSGLSALHMATQGDHVDCARLLLVRGTNIDDTTIDLLTPLHVAAHCGYTRVAKLLLDHRCMVNARALNGFTPLHIACKKNRIRVIELLLQYSCAIEATTESGLTPLHVAAFMGHTNVAVLLMQHGANPNSPTVRSETPLHLAVRSNQVEVVRALLRSNAQVDARAKDNQTPLHIASRLGNAEMTTVLLEAGANPDATCKDNYTALHVAAREGHEDVAAVLLDNKASLQLATKKGATPLHNAAKYDKIGVAKLLLARGADPNARGRNGLTPLHLAAHYNRTSIAAALLEAKANANCLASNGYTPLHIAARKNHLDLARQLMSGGANTRAESKSGFAPLHLAAQEGHPEMCAALLSSNAAVDQASHNGITPLHLAAQEDRVTSAEVLVVQHGGQIDPQTKAGYTPLHTACFFNQVNMIRFLLRHGAGVNALTQQKFTPLHVASQQGHLQVVYLLLEAGADANMRNARNWTPAHIAKKQNYINIFEVLRQVTTIIENWEEEIILEETIEISKPDTIADHHMSESDDDGGVTPKLRRPNHAGSPTGAQHLGASDTLRSRGSESADSVFDERHVNANTLMRSDSYNKYTTSVDYLEDEMLYTTTKLGSVLETDNKTGGAAASASIGGMSALLQPEGSTEFLLCDDASSSAAVSEHEHDESSLIEEPEMKKSTAGQQQLQSRPSTRSKGAQKLPVLLTPPQPASVARKGSKSSNRSKGDAVSVDETTHDIEKIGTLSSQKDNVAMEQIEPSSYMSQYREPEALTPPENYITGKDNVAPQRIPVVSGFLVSFLVDARGGAMNGSRFPGLRIVIPPNAASAPTRITCRLMRQGRVSRPPQFNDGEGLACRVIEMGPSNATFNSNVLIEVPHFASMRDREREIVVLRSDNGETWKEHTVEVTEQSVIDAVGGAFGSMPTNDDLRKKRIVRILTNSFPQYFALVTRIRQESALIGPEGGVISSTVIGQVQAVFPESALTKKIRVGIQALPVPTEQVNRLLGNRVAVSPVVTIEPRRRKFHKPITLTIPLPKPATRGITNPGESPTLRLLCSITGGVQPATWEDITGSTPLSYVKDCVSFTTTVSARFWLMDCPNTTESADMAGKLYRDAFLVPYMGRFVIFAKRTEQEEAKLRCFCITDDKVDKTLECNEGFERKAESREVEVLDSKPQWIEGVGNLTPTSKNGDQLFLPFRAFKENRLAFPVKIKDPNEPAIGKIAFLKDPRPTKPTDSPSLKPICTLEVQLPDYVSDGSSPKPDKSTTDQPELLSFTTDRIARSELDLRDLADCVRADWPMLARELGVGQSDITNAKVNFRDDRDRAFAVLCQWQRERGPEATGNEMERALRRIGRDDVVKKCMRNVEYVVGEDEKRQAKSLLDKQEAEDRHSGSNRSSQPPLEDVADDEAGAGDFVKPSVDERHGPPPPAKSEAEQAKEREAKSEAFLSLIDSMNSMTPEPEVHLPASNMEGQEVDTPQAAPVSHTAPPQRHTPPPSPAERAEDADDEARLKEEARQFAEGVMERQDDLQRHEQEQEDLDNQQEGGEKDAPVEAIQLQQPLVEASPQSVPEVEQEVEQETQPELEAEVQPEVEPEVQPEVEQEAQPEVEQEAQPEVEQEAQPEVEQEEPKPAQTVSSVPENEANPDEASAAMASAAGQDDEAETQPAEEDEQQQQQQGGKKKRRNKKKKLIN
ncbi:hypothetical protein BOX15_Mlig001678g5 [Macrostomum lignano]|uniref:ANK_REP_REGION domain-containing protein n=2 Tax=Macrostomum lignano TaxID=282301 RepID=A0A267H5D2_9PLAT|nr:hypothetical protein BOX15_Mlig001678g5 [Macrostomum lignano]